MKRKIEQLVRYLHHVFNKHRIGRIIGIHSWFRKWHEW